VPIKRPSRAGTRMFNGVGPFLFYFLNSAEREQHQACVSVRVLNATDTVSPR
jgi:hypothetical protein